MTSSPAPIPKACKAIWSPAVQEFTAIACVVPMYSAKSDSKRLTFGPMVIQPDRSESTTSAISSSPIEGSAYGKNDLRAHGAVLDKVLIEISPT